MPSEQTKKEKFFSLLHKAIQPPRSKGGRKQATVKPVGYSGTKTRRRKSASASVKQSDKSRG